MMFEIGAKVFYPMHGAGVIEAIQEKEILGEKQRYYVLNITSKNMQVLIPEGKTSHLGIRKVVDSKVMEDVLSIFNEGETDQSLNQNQRHRVHKEKIKSGDIYQGAEVIRDLARISRKRSLGTEDKNMLTHAQQIFLSELVLVKELSEEEAHEMLKGVLNNDPVSLA